MKIEHRGRKPNIGRRTSVNILHNAGYSYEEIAKMLGMKSRQLVRYYTLDNLKRKSKIK